MTTDTRTTLNLPAEMTRAIDNYWHAEQLRSRNEAIRKLLLLALEWEEWPGQSAMGQELKKRGQWPPKPPKEQRRG